MDLTEWIALTLEDMGYDVVTEPQEKTEPTEILLELSGSHMELVSFPYSYMHKINMDIKWFSTDDPTTLPTSMETFITDFHTRILDIAEPIDGIGSFCIDNGTIFKTGNGTQYCVEINISFEKEVSIDD